MTSTLLWSSIFERMGSNDPDFRYMATSDLHKELEKDTVHVDAETQRKLCSALLKRLDDSSGDVQGLAVKCLGVLIKKMNETMLTEVADNLCSLVLASKEDKRDIAGITLKTFIAQVDANTAASSVRTINRRLIEGLTQSTVAEVQAECLDLNNELLQRFGSLLDKTHSNMLTSLLSQLSSPKASIRKRVGANLASLAPSLNAEDFGKLMDHLVTAVTPSGQADHVRAAVRVVSATSRTAGARLGPYLEKIYPNILQITQAESTDENDELREGCLQALESFVLRCPLEITAHISSVIDIALTYLSYDPNYSDDYEEDDEDIEMEDGDDEDEESYESAGDYSDDDDMSWKVRRASAKILSAVILNRPELVTTLYDTVAAKLVVRFREREENVRLDVLSTFVDLVRQTAIVSSRDTLTSQSGTMDSDHALNLFVGLLPSVMKAFKKLFAEKSVKTRLGAFQLLKEIAIVVPEGALGDYIQDLVKGCVSGVTDRKYSNPSIKIEAITVLRLLLGSHDAKVFHPHLSDITSTLYAAVAESYYKITSEALRACCVLITVLRPFQKGASPVPDLAREAKQLYEASLPRMTATDQDQEVKETAISLAGLLVAHLGDVLEAELSTVLPLLLDRLENEITRLPTVRVVGTICQSPLDIDISSMFGKAVPALASYLRKSNRALRQAALQTLRELIERYSARFTPEYVTVVMTELIGLIDDSDLQLAHLALLVVAAVIRAPGLLNADQLKTAVMPKVAAVVSSPLLQGAALKSVLVVFEELSRASTRGGSPISFDGLRSVLLQAAEASSLPAQARPAIAKSLGVIATNASPEDLQSTVSHFLGLVSKKSGPIGLPLLTLGEIGARADLSGVNDLASTIVGVLASGDEETKMAASLALGNLAVGNLKHFVPFILQQIDASPNHQYLLLHSLKETISRPTSGVADLQAFLDPIVTVLFRHAQSDEEGLRNVVSECLGKLSIAYPDTLVPRLLEAVKAAEPTMRATAVSSLKFAFNDSHEAAEAAFAASIGDFLALLSDSDLNVRRSALVVLNCVAHNRSSMLYALLPTILPQLYKETVKDASLVREVSLGPFKHLVDDGLELRKCAFECMDTLLSSSLSRLDLFPFIEHLTAGLGDDYDIKMSCHLMLTRLTRASGARVLAATDKLIPSLKATLNARTRKDAVEQEVSRHNDMVRSALRAVVAMSEVPGATGNPDFAKFVEEIQANADLKDKFASLRAEQTANPTVGDRMDTS